MALCLCGALTGCSAPGDPADLALAPAAYGELASGGACASAAKPGPAGASDAQRAPAGPSYNLRTPSNYEPRRAHPLLLVFAAAGASPKQTEALTRLTAKATGQGFIVAYAQHRTLSPQGVQELATLPRAIAERWCIDLRRVFATGHSDGGTVSTAMALLGTTRGNLAGIAPSAAGFARQAFAAQTCAAPMPAMVLHGRQDRLFPAWGQAAAQWWAACNRCEPAKTTAHGAHCLAFQGCAAGAATLYCEHEGSHTDWPAFAAAEIVAFFATAAAVPR